MTALRDGQCVERHRLPSWHSPVLALVPGIAHGVSTRLGGVSRPPFASLNLGLHTADRPGDVQENRRRWFAGLGVALEAAVFGEQVHGAAVARVDRSSRGRGALRHEDAVRGVDALVTTEPGVVLAALFADCLPILLAARDGSAVAVAHAGWRGTAARVAERVVEALLDCGASANGLRVALGPCIKPCCYEVSDELYERFGSDFGSEATGRTRAGRPALDLAGANRLLLTRLGVEPAAIDVSPLCTACRTDLFFSHRAEMGITGRIAATIAIREDRG